MKSGQAFALVLLVMPLSGCGKARPQAEVDRGKQAVTAALESWKNNEPAAKLQQLADPVSFADELQATQRLVDYVLGKPDTNDPQVIRYPVTLTLRDRKGKVSTREAVFAVRLATPIIVARDPYF